MLDLDQLLQYAVEQRASDIHLKVGSRPFLRVDGVLRQTPFEVVEPEETERIALGIMPPRRAEQFRHGLEADFVYSAAGRGRFRVERVPPAGLGGPGDATGAGVAAGLRRTGPAPGGPATRRLDLGARPRHRARRLGAYVDVGVGPRPDQPAPGSRHIVTIEDPIEVLHPDKRSIVTQREVGTDTESFHEAILHALRQDPDVLFVSRLHDAATARAALEAADVGHLVFASMPTVSAADTVTQIIEMFPPHERPQIRGLLARALRGIVCQRCCRAPAAGAGSRRSRCSW